MRCSVVMEREDPTRSRGFGFVTLSSQVRLTAAIPMDSPYCSCKLTTPSSVRYRGDTNQPQVSHASTAKFTDKTCLIQAELDAAIGALDGQQLGACVGQTKAADVAATGAGEKTAEGRGERQRDRRREKKRRADSTARQTVGSTGQDRQRKRLCVCVPDDPAARWAGNPLVFLRSFARDGIGKL